MFTKRSKNLTLVIVCIEWKYQIIVNVPIFNNYKYLTIQERLSEWRISKSRFFKSNTYPFSHSDSNWVPSVCQGLEEALWNL